MTIDEQIHEAYKNSRNYPELVQMLIVAGVQSYTVDVASDIKLYHLADHSTVLHGEAHKEPRKIAHNIDVAKVKACIKASQAMEMSYAEFMPAIAEAGVLFYDAVLAGDNKRVNYIGIGGNHEEQIPL
ncbi:MAG: DUF1398 family protein [Phycisphaerales bacterium]|nr:DUF1398 family protein [Phycisphaerales bacterium]